MEHSHIGKDGLISVVQEKTGNRVWIPISNDLKTTLDAWSRRQTAWIKNRLNRKKPLPIPLDATRMLLTGQKGRHITTDYFRHLIIDGAQAPPHGCASSALSWDIIAAITGHDTAAWSRERVGNV